MSYGVQLLREGFACWYVLEFWVFFGVAFDSVIGF